jgi:hypothetical protein
MRRHASNSTSEREAAHASIKSPSRTIARHDERLSYASMSIVIRGLVRDISVYVILPSVSTAAMACVVTVVLRATEMRSWTSVGIAEKRRG